MSERVSAKPTTYAGVNFRSRLEARWAAFFDALGWPYEYEPFDVGGYIPDFVLLGERPVVVEVKPAVSVEEMGLYSEKIERGLAGKWDGDYLVVGVTPLFKSAYWEGFCVGLLSEWWPDYDQGSWVPGEGVWHRCRCGGCGDFAFHHEIHSYAGRPCGHYDGDGYLGRITRDEIASRWAHARNEVQWKAT